MTNTPKPAQLKPWGDIHRDYKSTDANGKRWVLVYDNGTTLAPWYGPKGATR